MRAERDCGHPCGAGLWPFGLSPVRSQSLHDERSLAPRGVSSYPACRYAGSGISSPLARLRLAHPRKAADAQRASAMLLKSHCRRLLLSNRRCQPVGLAAARLSRRCHCEFMKSINNQAAAMPEKVSTR